MERLPEFGDQSAHDDSSSINFVSTFLALTETQLQAVTPKSADQALRAKSSSQSFVDST
jgi:hypothetical protein